MAEDAHWAWIGTDQDQPEAEGFVHDVRNGPRGAWQRCNDPKCTQTGDHVQTMVARRSPLDKGSAFGVSGASGMA